MSAVISPCGLYRYRLERQLMPRFLGVETHATVIMVNPSTADADTDDATIRKLIGFGARLNWASLTVGNLFAYRATDVRHLGAVADPVGPDNDFHLFDMIRNADTLVFAWGPLAKQPKHLRGRFWPVLQMAHMASRKPMSIGETAKDGHPRHPLMLPYSSELQPWSAPSMTHKKRALSVCGAEGEKA